MYWIWLHFALELSPAAAGARQQAEALLVQWRGQFSSAPIRAIDCGVPVDGSSDSTGALNQCLATLPPWSTLDGGGLRYEVTQVNLRSRLRLQNFRLIKRAGVTNLQSVVSLNGEQTALSDVMLEDIEVDGRRAAESGIDSPSTEDGGRHCFRFAGRLSRVALVRVKGNLCGTDGLHLAGHHATLSDEPEGLPIQQVVVQDAEFQWNRRAGLMFEGGHEIYFLDVRARFNGRTLEDAPADLRSGAVCANVKGWCFGTGVWTENDHDAAGGSFHNVSFVNLTATGNQRRGFYAYSQSHPGVTGFRPKSRLLIADSVLDAGVAPVAGNPQAIQFLSAGRDGGGAVFRDVRIVNTQILGTVGARLLEGLVLDGVTSEAPLLGFLEYFDQVEVGGGSRRGDFVSTRWLRPDGSGGAVVRYLAP